MSSKDPAELLREIADLRAQLDKKQAEVERLNELVDQDMFLPLLNRRAFDRELFRAWSFAQRYDVQIALIYFDLDGLKVVNDEYGHGVGDKALSAIADILIENSRDSDIAGRMGGDEFALLLMHADEKQGQKKATELSEKIATKPVETNQNTITITASYGVSGLSQAGTHADMIRLADQQMYQMKLAKQEKK